MSTHRAKLADGEVWSLPAGASFQILETDKPVDVEFIYNGQRRSRAKEVERTYYYRPYIDLLDDSGQAFHTVRITAAYGSCSVVVDISDANAGTNSLTGVVEVVNADRERTDRGVAYFGFRTAPEVVGKYSASGVVNETGTGVAGYVNQVVVTSSKNLNGVIWLVSDVTSIEADAAYQGVTNASRMSSKNVGGGVGKMLPRSYLNDIGALPSSFAIAVGRIFVQANSSYVIKFSEPVRVGENCGVIVTSTDPDQDVAASFEVFEEEVQ